MSKVQGVDQRLAHIGIDMARQASKPCFNGVQTFVDRRESESVDNPLHRTGSFLNSFPAFGGNRYRRGQITERYMIATKSLEGEIGVDNFVVRIGIVQFDRLVVENLP